jgi:hypothetical protein
MKLLCRVWLFCSLALWFSAPSVAQISTTSLRGVVTDASQAVVPGAVVSLRNAANGTHYERTTDARGEYLFLQIPPGTFEITVKASGFGDQSTHTELLVNQPATQNFTLSVQTAVTSINVSSTALALNTTDATMGEAVNNATIQALPMEGRNVPDLLSLQPGVLYLGHNINQNLDSRSGAVSGSRSDQGNVTVDGIDDNDQINGYAFTGVLRSTLDSVEEFRVTTTGSNADTGRSSGAQVNMVTKSGTNQIHGSLYEYNRNTLATANNWFNKQGEAISDLPNVPGKLIRNTFGASAGGPIKKDKLFYFFNYESQRTAENQQQVLTVPTTSFRAGNLSYTNASNGTTTLTPAQVAAMDPKCSAAGTCPWGPGADPNTLALFQEYPSANGFVAGDGLNTASFTWSAPNPVNLNTSILKFDYAPNGKHRIFARGNLQDDTTLAAPQLPGQAASNTLRDNTKGAAAGDIWSPTSNLVNNARYGFIRQGYSDRGIGQGSYVNFGGQGNLSNLTAETRSSLYSVPVHNLIDDVSWTKGAHTLQFGANWRLIHNQLSSNALSFDSAAMTGYDVTGSGFANTGQSFDPAAFGNPAVDGNFANSYNLAVADLAGIIPQVTNQYNYSVSKDGSTGTLAAQGAYISHDFKANEFEYYLQDSWRMRRNLTVSFGLRHTLLQTPYEVNGQQVQTTTSLHDWFATRSSQAAKGIVDQPLLSFAPSGQARGLKPYWEMKKANLAPRLAIAYSPNGRMSIRAGFGMFYDHFGQGIVNSFSQYGSYGLQGQKQTPNDALSPDNAPRFTDLHTIPSVNGVIPGSISYPYMPSSDPFSTGFATAIGLDDKVHTPYSYTMDLSVQQELSKGFSFELAYVGRLGRHLMQQMDLAAPLDLADPKSGQDFYTAATTLTKAVYAGASTVAPVAYFEDLFPDAANKGADGSGTEGNSATQNIYQNLFEAYPVNSSYIQYSLGILCSPGCGGQTGQFYTPQFNSLFSWVSNGTSNYNALQVILRHPMSHGLQMDLSYTFSKSLDLGSDTERSCVQCGSNVESTFSWIVNAFRPRENYGVSDFDTTHLITADWVYQLPVGSGQRFAGESSHLVNALIGGWQLSGLTRWTSGLPFTVMAGNGWEVDWSQESAMVKTGYVKMHKHQQANGAPQVFADPQAVLAGIPDGPPLRNPLPGEAGTRNGFRGDGYFGVDSGLAKSWTIHEQQAVKFSWEVFNVTNSVRFDVNPLNSLQNQTSSGSFGVYGAVLTQPRIQQFSLRYSF